MPARLPTALPVRMVPGCRLLSTPAPWGHICLQALNHLAELRHSRR